MVYIRHIDSISFQNSFQCSNLWDVLHPLDSESTLQNPEYKLHIQPTSLRRLSTILRMGIATAKSCTTDFVFDGISYGTSLGCLTDTEKFLQVVNTVTGDVFSPTAFIQSTHNTIAGQISLELKNHAYNMTHTQNTLSFEVALLDGMLLIQEGKKHVLVGAADEAIPFMERLRPDIITTHLPLTSGATSMALVPESNQASVQIMACQTFHNVNNEQEVLADFLIAQGISATDINLVLVANELETAFVSVNYTTFTGYYQTSSAFAVHLGVDFFAQNTEATYVLIFNNLDRTQLGLTLLKRV